MIKVNITCDCGREVKEVRPLKSRTEGNFNIYADIEKGEMVSVAFVCIGCGERLELNREDWME